MLTYAGMTTADITNGLADVLAIKTKQQLAAARGAGQVSLSLSLSTHTHTGFGEDVQELTYADVC
jgi:hypothetical protein